MNAPANGPLLHVVGARPNFLKMAPVLAALRNAGSSRQIVVHTGQHYDPLLSDIFFRELELPPPDCNLEVGSGSMSAQVALILSGLEKILLREKPRWVFVYGDVTSTLAAALCAAQNGIRVAHVEAGLRSGDWTMPEELNRTLTDRISTLLFTHSPEAGEHLRREGIPVERIHFVGNTMIDSVVRLLPKTHAPPGVDTAKRFVVVTLHRPATVDSIDALLPVLEVLDELGKDVAVFFPVHPRTRRTIERSDRQFLHIRFVEPLGYTQFLWMLSHAFLVITDSGGVQEETTYLGTSCLTYRNNTERPITISLGTNQLVGCDAGKLQTKIEESMRAPRRSRQSPPELWDGKAAQRIAAVMRERIGA